MPCFSATNERFISAEQQQHHQQQQEKKQKSHRAKTAPRIAYRLSQSHHGGSNGESKSDGQWRETLNSMRSMRNNGACNGPVRIKPGKTQFLQAFRPKTVTLNYKEFERLRNSAKIITIDERLEALARREELAKQLEEQAEQARQHFRKIDEQRLEAAAKNSNKGAEEENLFGSLDKKKTLERAFIAKHEQEEEVKAVNRIILNAKCHAVRDAQMQEKHDIERDQKAAEARLEKLVIDESLKALTQEDCHAEQKKIRNAKYANEIRQQLVHREYIRFMEAERAEEEARIQRAAAAALKREEERQAREQRERRRKFREELNAVVEMSNLFKKMLCEQEQEADMRVAAYMREKREREKELEREKKLAKEEFERQQERLYDLAQKIADSKAQRDELSYIRNQEQAEREYRRREKEIALRKKQLELDIKEARERQMQETKARQALQLAREEKDFNILIENLKKEEKRLQQQEEERRKQRISYRAEIIRQMGDKAIAKRRMMEDERTEANLWREAENQRLANVRAVIKAKLSAMREACLPERYIRDVERQLNRFIRSSSKKPDKNEQ